MNSSHLRRIQDWPQRAHEVKYSVRELAKGYGMSVRVLERRFSLAVRDSPRHLLKRLRMQRAIELLRDGSNVNETADRLGYKYSTHFSAEFKQVYGVPPRDHARIHTAGRRTSWNGRKSI
jgi:transcriptional regulator GlxA family with amidase domain